MLRVNGSIWDRIIFFNKNVTLWNCKKIFIRFNLLQNADPLEHDPKPNIVLATLRKQ